MKVCLNVPHLPNSRTYLHSAGECKLCLGIHCTAPASGEEVVLPVASPGSIKSQSLKHDLTYCISILHHS